MGTRYGSKLSLYLELKSIFVEMATLTGEQDPRRTIENAEV